MLILKRIVLSGSLVLAVAAVSGCKSESAPKAPEKKDSLDAKEKKDLDDPSGDGEEEQQEQQETPSTESATPLTLEVSDQAALTAKAGAPVSITFNIKGAGSKEILVGMMSSPSGATVEVSGTTVTYKWQAPTGGTYPLKFLLRDKAKCEAAASPSACVINNSDTALTAKAYDTASQEFSLTVNTDDSLTLPGTGGGGSNDQLIQQIVALLGGGGGGGISSLLNGLSNGQLQTLLGQLKTGGGGGGITQLIGLLGNL